MTAISSGISQLTLGAIVPVEPETDAYVARFTTPPSVLRKLAINKLIYALKASGAWSKLDAAYLLTNQDSQAASLNLVSTSFSLTASTAPTFTADYGAQGNPTTSAVYNTNLAPSAAVNFTQNSASLGVYVLNNVDDAHDDVGTIQATIRARSSNQMVFRINQAASTTVAQTGAQQNSTGLTWVSRDDATNVRYGKDATITGSYTAASVAVDTANFLICGGRAISNPNSSLHVVGAVLIGASLTNAQWAAISKALDAYMNFIARPSGFFH